GDHHRPRPSAGSDPWSGGAAPDRRRSRREGQRNRGYPGDLPVRQQRSPADGFCRPPPGSRSRNREGQRRRLGATDLILKVSVPRWITDGMVITNARALRLAETHGLAGPRLIAAHLACSPSGTVATLETFLSGS